MTTQIKIKTWYCSTCGYKQDFNPNNIKQWREIFPNIRSAMCPNPPCGKKKLKLLPNTMAGHIVVNIATDDEIDHDDNIKPADKDKMKSQADRDRVKFNSSEWKS